VVARQRGCDREVPGGDAADEKTMAQDEGGTLPHPLNVKSNAVGS
jgi:hypothetical protein